MKRNILLFFLQITLSLSISTVGFAHGGKKNIENEEPIGEDKLELINKSYTKNVKPIFKTKCLDCHGTGNKMPWYFSIPGPRQLMEHDIEEAKEHLDMSKDFPFSGQGSPAKDLEELKEVVEEGSMPPWQYKIVHWDSSLTKSEKDIVKNWITESQRILLGADKRPR